VRKIENPPARTFDRAKILKAAASRPLGLSSAMMLRALACFLIAAALLAAVALTASAGSTQARCRPTPSDGAGPFQQGGVNVPRRAKIGTGHVLLGRVLRAGDCAPVAGALVVLWQAGPNGYGPRGRGSVRTDRSGRFRFEGPVPASYGREPHIHLAVFHPAYEELAARYVVRPGAKSGRIRLVLTPLL
jgi:protocatechuate 3,4-dioxygenase beta subunit